MKYHEVMYEKDNALELHMFRDMDYHAVKHLNLPIELMMENAGMNLASFVAGIADKDLKIKIGVGNGNNGGRACCRSQVSRLGFRFVS